MSKFAEMVEWVRQQFNRGDREGVIEKLEHIEREHEREIGALSRELREVKAELANSKETNDRAQVRIRDLLDRPRGLETLWNHADGRRIIEAAFAHDPHGTKMALDYLGSSSIAGELRDRAIAAGNWADTDHGRRAAIDNTVLPRGPEQTSLTLG